MPHRLPPLAVLLGVGGLVPFVVCGVAALGATDWAALALLALLGYGAVILSFLGAVHWGLALVQPGVAERARLAGGVLPSLAGWVTLLVAFTGLPSVGLAVLAAGFAATMLVEAQAGRRGLLPPGYVWLRWLLTGVVVVVLVSVLFVHLLGLHVNF